MVWVLFILRAIVSLAVLGVALAAVRPTAPRAGYSLAAAAGLDLLFSCCLRASYSQVRWDTMDPSNAEPIRGALACVGTTQSLLVGVLVIVAMALGAREVKSSGGPTPPPAVR